MHQSATKRQALLPASREASCQAVDVLVELVRGYGFLDFVVQSLSLQLIGSTVETKVLEYGEVVVQTEFLAHVADPLTNGIALRPHIKALNPGFAFGDGQNSGQHFDHRGLAAAVGPEKAEDFSLLHFDRGLIHRDEVTESPRQIFGFNGQHYLASEANCTSAL